MSTLTNGLRVKEAQAEMVIAPKPPSQDLLVSLDFFRGFTMFMLVGECTGLYELLRAPAFGGALLGAIGLQLDHHPWNGLRCWDLVQPFFMFIVGVAMPFAIGRRWERGDSWGKTFKHALTRSGMLLLCGWGAVLHPTRPPDVSTLERLGAALLYLSGGLLDDAEVHARPAWIHLRAADHHRAFVSAVAGAGIQPTVGAGPQFWLLV